MVFSPDGRILASSGADEVVRVWDVATGRELRSFAGDFIGVKPLAFSQDSKLLACGMLREIKVWEVATGREARVLKGDTTYVNALAFSPDGKILASGSGLNDGAEIKLWDAQT